MMAGSSAPGSKPGWVYDASSGYYHDPSTGVYFDQQRGAYHAHGRWLSHAEYTATYSKSVAAPQHVVHPSLSRGGVGRIPPRRGQLQPRARPPGAAAPPVSTGGWGHVHARLRRERGGRLLRRQHRLRGRHDPPPRRVAPTRQPTPLVPAPASAPLRPTPLGLAAERGDVPEVNRLLARARTPTRRVPSATARSTTPPTRDTAEW